MQQFINWQTIKDIPMDGTQVLIVNGNRDNPTISSIYYDGDFWILGRDAIVNVKENFTHFAFITDVPNLTNKNPK